VLIREGKALNKSKLIRILLTSNMRWTQNPVLGDKGVGWSNGGQMNIRLFSVFKSE